MNETRRVVFYLLGLLFMFLLNAEVLPATDFTDKRLFLLYSYHPTFPTAPKVYDGIHSVFSENSPIIEIEYMDSKRLYDESSRELFLAQLQYKLSHRDPYDLLITADDNALDFMLEHGESLFPGVPTVFLGVNDVSKAKEQNSNPIMTGIIEASSFDETLSLIEQLQPSRKKLHIIVDGTTSGQADLQSVFGIRDNFAGNPINIISLTEHNWQEFADRLEILGEEDAILLLSAYRDRRNISKSFDESLSIIKESTEAPIYHLWEHGMGDGILGGVLVNHREQGRQAALIAQRILQGESIHEIEVLDRSPNVPMFDYRQLQRFNIPEENLPSDAQVLYRPQTIWLTHRTEITAVLIILSILALTSIYLARQSLIRLKMSRALSEKTQFLHLLMNTIPDLVWIKDPNGNYLGCNSRFESLLGSSEDDIIGQTDFDFFESSLATSFQEQDRQVMEEKKTQLTERHVQFDSDGHSELLEIIKTSVIDSKGVVLGVLGVGRNITERRATEEKVRVLSQAVDQSPISIMITDSKNHIEYVNHRFEQITGYRQQEVLGRTPDFLKSGNTPEDTYKSLWKALSIGKTWEGEFQNRKKNGELIWEYANIAAITNENGTVCRYLAFQQDITTRKEQHEKILYQAHYDSLTGLPNKELALDRLDQLLKQGGRQQKKVGLLFIDLDDFKKINDSLGHDAGDSILIKTAARLKETLRTTDTVGRLGGDEFIVLLNDLNQEEDAGIVAGNLIKNIRPPFTVDSHEFFLSASIGISLFPNDGKSPKDLLRKADTAMYSAKHSGRATYVYFTKKLNETVKRRFAIEEQLYNALERNEFHLQYQPKIDLKTGKIVGIEALLRWHSRFLGDISPIEFIPIAEQTGVIVEIGHYVLETAIKDIPSCCPLQKISLAVNLSPRQFRNEKLMEELVSLFQRVEFPPSLLEFEITEGVLMEHNVGIPKILTELHDFGIQLAMDDFGTGYSSLSYLRRYPFDTLKIDREFINGITQDEADRELVLASISMAHGLGLKVVAEGVETSEQHEILLNMGCDMGQGFFYSQPVPASKIKELLAGEN